MLDIYDEFRRLVEAFDAQKVDYAVSRAGLIAMKQLRKSGQDLDDIEALAEGGRDAEN